MPINMQSADEPVHWTPRPGSLRDLLTALTRSAYDSSSPTGTCAARST